MCRRTLFGLTSIVFFVAINTIITFIFHLFFSNSLLYSSIHLWEEYRWYLWISFVKSALWMPYFLRMSFLTLRAFALEIDLHPFEINASVGSNGLLRFVSDLSNSSVLAMYSHVAIYILFFLISVQLAISLIILTYSVILP